MGWCICYATAENRWKEDISTEINWASGVNQKIRRDTTWSEISGYIADETMSGKAKRRMAHSLAKRPFSISMLFDYTEYGIFKGWYQNTIKQGTLSFNFPKIDGSGTAEYRFTQPPQYSNESGKVIRCTMEWEEV